MKFFKYISPFIYFMFLCYVVFFTSGRFSNHYNNEINFIPIKNSIHTFLTLNKNDRREFYDFYLNLFGNIILFLPFAFILRSAFNIGKLKPVLLLTILLSAAIEMVQYIFQIGLADIDDIILNTIGAIIGFFLYRIFIRLDFTSLLKQAN